MPLFLTRIRVTKNIRYITMKGGYIFLLVDHSRYRRRRRVERSVFIDYQRTSSANKGTLSLVNHVVSRIIVRAIPRVVLRIIRVKISPYIWRTHRLLREDFRKILIR